jgi:inner membrane protein
MTVATLPDIDIIFNRIPIDSLLLHRGITHALPALPAFAILCAFLMYPFWRRATPNAWTLGQTALFAFMLLLMHVWLDCVTNYGTLAFLPFSDYRVRLNGLFIVDFWLLIPLILAACASRRRPRLAALAVAWLFLYSGGATAWSMHLQDKWRRALKAEGITPTQLHILPDAFAPLNWKVKYEHNGQCFLAPLNLSGLVAGPWMRQQSADPALLARLSREDRSISIWMRFSLLPLQDEQDWENGREYTFYDWRFVSLVPFAQKIIQRRRPGSDDTPFKIMARVDNADKLVAVRYIPGGGDSGWQPPVAPKERSGIHRLIGLDE